MTGFNIGFNSFAKFNAIHNRHHYIAYNQIGVIFIHNSKVLLCHLTLQKYYTLFSNYRKKTAEVHNYLQQLIFYIFVFHCH